MMSNSYRSLTIAQQSLNRLCYGGNVVTKAVFFDRDGVLNIDKDYLYKIEDFEWQEEAPQAIKFLKEQGYFIFVVTNQSGVARGYYTEQDMHNLHEHMQAELRKIGTQIDAFYHCPHLPEATVTEYAMDCNCRKPEPGMIIRAIAEHNIDPQQSFLIGDKHRDIQAGQAAGVRGYLYKEGSLLEFVRSIAL